MFETAVYIDSLSPMKGKEKRDSEVGYHHFVAPLIMNNQKYRVFITTREKVNSNILYVISAEVLLENLLMDENNDISLENLVNNIKIWNYDLEEYQIYDINNIVFDGFSTENEYRIETEILILH